MRTTRAAVAVALLWAAGCGDTGPLGAIAMGDAGDAGTLADAADGRVVPHDTAAGTDGASADVGPGDVAADAHVASSDITDTTDDAASPGDGAGADAVPDGQTAEIAEPPDTVSQDAAPEDATAVPTDVPPPAETETPADGITAEDIAIPDAPEPADGLAPDDAAQGEDGGSAEVAAPNDGSGAADADAAADAGEPAGVRVVWDLAGALAATSDTLDFFQYPWPESQRRDADGTLRLAGFPNPATATGCSVSADDPAMAFLLASIPAAVYRQYVVDLLDLGTRDFGNNAAVYVPFDGALNEGNLPEPGATLSTSSPVFLLDVDPASPRRGETVPVAVRVFHTSRYLPDNTLAVLPVPGFPLAPATRYAVVVRRSLGDSGGEPLDVPPAFAQLQTDAPVTPQEVLYAAAFDLLETLSVPRADVAAMTVYRTQDPVAGLDAVASAIEATTNPSALAEVTVTGTTLNATAGYYQVSGTFNNLVYQRGTPPYLPKMALGAGIEVAFEPGDMQGELLSGPPPSAPGGTDPDTPRTEAVPFELTLPVAVVDAAGAVIEDLPLVLYAHGTGGSRKSALGNDDEAAELAALGIATVAIDQVMHGVRAHADNLDPELVSTLQSLGGLLGQDLLGALQTTLKGGALFFNPLQINAARGNVLQSAVDAIWQAHVFGQLDLAVLLPGDDARTIRFDPTRIGFMGHSQGGLTGPLTSQSTRIGATVLSAPGGHLVSSLLHKTKPAAPFRVKDMMAYVVCDADPDINLDVHHPLMNVLMTGFEAAEPLNYARQLLVEPNKAPRSVFITEGTDDHYATPETNEALTTAAHLNQVGPELAPVLGQALLDLIFAADPEVTFGLVDGALSGNVTVAGVPFTGGFRQYHGETGCADDHYVSMCVPTARADWTGFFATWLTGTPVIGGP